MNQPLRLLIVDDSDDDAALVLHALRRGGYEVAYDVVETPATMRAALERQKWDVITSDHSMPHFSTPAALALAKTLRPDVPFIVVSGDTDLQLVVSLMKMGVQDYIPKQDLARLVPAIEDALRGVEVRRKRQQGEDALQVSEMRYRRLFETAQDGILILDADTGQIIDVNPFLTAMLGYTQGDLLGKHLWDIGLFTDMEASKRAFAALQRHGYIRYEDLPLATRDGRQVAVEFVSNSYSIDHQHVIQCNIRDITVRKQLEQYVQDRTRQLEALNQALEAFNSAVSHDLRAPLRRIDGFVDLLRESYADTLDAEGLQLIQTIRASTQHMNGLIEALLGLSHVSRHALEWQVVDVSALAHLIAADLQHSQPTRQVNWVIADGLTTYGDARLLRIVLDNLLHNAWKFTATQAQARIEVGGQTTPPEGTPMFFVRDNGAGFDMTHVDRLFGAFQRLHTEKQFPGTGIGLATVQRIIHRHGGQVWAEGAVDQGATFYFSLSKGVA
jgi:PAS domain S-box-containing protein